MAMDVHYAPSEHRQARMEHNTASEKKEAGVTVLGSAGSLAGGAVCLVRLNFHAAEEQAQWLHHH